MQWGRHTVNVILTYGGRRRYARTVVGQPVYNRPPPLLTRTLQEHWVRQDGLAPPIAAPGARPWR